MKLYCATILLTLLITSCGLDRPDGLYEPRESVDMMATDMGESSELGQPDMAVATGALTGTWLLVHSQSTCVLGTEQLATTDYLVEITQQGSALTETRKICGVNLSPVLGTSVQIPEATREWRPFARRSGGRWKPSSTGHHPQPNRF